MAVPSGAPAQPDPAWIVGKHALMNVRATSRRGRTEIDPLRWRIPFQWQGCHYQDHDDQPFMLLVNSGGGFVEGDVSHFHALLEPGYPRPLHHHGIEQVLQVPGRRRLARDRGSPCRRRRAAGVLPGRGDPLRPEPGAPDQPDRYDALVPALRHRHGLGRPCALRRGRGLPLRPSGLGVPHRHRRPPGRPRPPGCDRGPRPSPRSSGCGWGGCTWRRPFAYAPDLAPGVEDGVHEAIAGVDGTEAGVTRIGNLVIVRILSHETWQAHEALFNAWAALRPAIAGKNARPDPQVLATRPIHSSTRSRRPLTAYAARPN